MAAVGYTGGDPHKVDVAGDTMTGELDVPGGPVVPSEAISVMVHGAVGDGTTDDTAAIQAAIDALPGVGGVVYFPAGDFKVTAPITLRSDLIIQGSGQDKTYIRQTATDQDCLSGTDISYLALCDLQIYGPGSGTGNGVNLVRSSADATPKVTLTNVVVYNFGASGIVMSNPIVSSFINVSSINNQGHGYFLHGVDAGSAGTSVFMANCYAEANAQAGYNLRKLTYSAMQGCAADHNGISYLIEACEGITLSGCGCESPVSTDTSYPGTGFKITGSTSVGIYNCWMAGNIETGWYITGSSAGVQLIGPRESAPAGATAFVKVDAGSKVVLMDAAGTTANSLAQASTSVLHDTNGNAALSGDLLVGKTGAQQFISAYNGDGSQRVYMYHNGTFGQLESTTGFVLFSDNGSAAVVGTVDPQLKVQYGGGSFNSVNISHDDTKGTIATTNGDLHIGPNGNIVTDSGLKVAGNIGFYNTGPVAKPTVSGSRGSNAALTSLLTALASMGLITDSSS